MKYPKDPYYLNSELRNKQKNNQAILDSNFEELKELLSGKEVFEVGFDFGQRLHALKDSCKVVGGIEFDPNFGLYQRHFNLFDHGWDIRFTQLEFWKPQKRKCVFTNNFLSVFNEEDRLVLLKILKDMSEELFLNESCKLNLEKQGNIYVFNNIPGNDIKSNSGTVKTKEVELPCFDTLRSGLKRTMANDENARKDQARQLNSSGCIQW